MTTITRKNVKLYQLDEESKKNFVPCSYHNLSDFQAQSLKWLGDAIRPTKSEFFWNNGCYCWWTEKQTHEFCVWMTENGIAMFEDVTNGILCRVIFN